MKHFFSRSSLVLMVGMCFSLTAQAETVPTSGINYSASEIHIRHTKAAGAADPFVCFGQSWAHSHGDWLSGDADPDTLDVIFSQTLASIGINNALDLSSIQYGGVSTDDCFQQSGTYDLKFRLEDVAGNEAWYPTDITSTAASTDWYTFEIKPSDPDAAQTGAPVVTGSEVLADNSTAYSVALTLRDAFGNEVTQIDSTADLDLFISTTLGDIEIDGLYDGVNPDENITHKQSGAGGLTSQIFDNGNSDAATVFASGVKLGGSLPTPVWQDLDDLLNENTSVTDVLVNEGVITFDIKSSVPSVKLLDGDPLNGAGIFQQPLVFHPRTTGIDDNGDALLAKKDMDGTAPERETVLESFSFHPLVTAEPAIPDDGITWAEPVNTVTVAITEAVATAVEYLFWAPVDEYLVKKNVIEDQGGELKEAVSFPDLWDESRTTFDNSSVLGAIRIVYEVVTGDVSGALPSDIGLGTMVEYFTPEGVKIRHHSESTGGNTGCASFDTGFIDDTDCYAFSGSSEVRNIGADIEGAFKGDIDEVLVYQVDDGFGSSGQKTTYAGEIKNDRLKERLFVNIDEAIRNPETEYTADTLLSAITFGTNNVAIIRDADLIIGDNDTNYGENLLAPTDRKTVIIVDGNVYFEDDLEYSADSDSLGIILYNTNQSRADETWPTTGNIFIHEDVQKMVGSYYADGSLISVGGTQYTDLKTAATPAAFDAEMTGLTYSGDKTNQLVLEGVIWANNTLGGALITDLYSTPWHNNGTASLDVAKLFDLHYVRRYPGTGTFTPINYANLGTADENSNAFVIRIDNKASYASTAPPVFQNLQKISR